MSQPDERFAHLLQPIRDLAANWNVSIAEELGEYLDVLEGISFTFGGGQSFNFAEAAMVIQGSACVYGRKVEYLHSLVFQALETVAARNAAGDPAVAGARRRAAAAAARAVAEAAADDWDESEGAEEAFLTLDDAIEEGQGIDEEDSFGEAAGPKLGAGARRAVAADSESDEEGWGEPEGPAGDPDACDGPRAPATPHSRPRTSGRCLAGGLHALLAEDHGRKGADRASGGFALGACSVHASGALLLQGLDGAALSRRPGASGHLGAAWGVAPAQAAGPAAAGSGTSTSPAPDADGPDAPAGEVESEEPEARADALSSLNGGPADEPPRWDAEAGWEDGGDWGGGDWADSRCEEEGTAGRGADGHGDPDPSVPSRHASRSRWADPSTADDAPADKPPRRRDPLALLDPRLPDGAAERPLRVPGKARRAAAAARPPPSPRPPPTVESFLLGDRRAPARGLIFGSLEAALLAGGGGGRARRTGARRAAEAENAGCGEAAAALDSAAFAALLGDDDVALGLGGDDLGLVGDDPLGGIAFEDLDKGFGDDEDAPEHADGVEPGAGDGPEAPTLGGSWDELAPLDALAAEDAGAGDADLASAQLLSYEELCHEHVERALRAAAAAAASTAAARRVAAWRDRVEPDLDAAMLKPPFDVEAEGERVLGRLRAVEISSGEPERGVDEARPGPEASPSVPSRGPDRVGFRSALPTGAGVAEVGRAFSAMLQLVNDGRLDLRRDVDEAAALDRAGPPENHPGGFSLRAIPEATGGRRARAQEIGTSLTHVTGNATAGDGGNERANAGNGASDGELREGPARLGPREASPAISPRSPLPADAHGAENRVPTAKAVGGANGAARGGAAGKAAPVKGPAAASRLRGGAAKRTRRA